MPTAEVAELEGRYSTPVSSKNLHQQAKNSPSKEFGADDSSPPPLAAPLSDDTLADADADAQEAAVAAESEAGKNKNRSRISSSPFAATPSPISAGANHRTLLVSDSEGNNGNTIDGTFDTGGGSGTNNSISRTLNISEIDESSVSLLLDNTNTNTNTTAGTAAADRREASGSSRRNSNSINTNNTTLQSVLELSEINDTTLDGAALHRALGGADFDSNSSSFQSSSNYASYRARDLSEINTTMDQGSGSGTTGTNNVNANANATTIEESKLQAELALEASERMQRTMEEATSSPPSGSGSVAHAHTHTHTHTHTHDGDENSTLAGQMYVGSGASVATSSLASYQYSIGGNTAATAGTDIAEFLKRQNEAMQKALAASGVGVGVGVGIGGDDQDGEKESTPPIISPTKTRVVDAAVANARIMAEATANLTPSSNAAAAGVDSGVHVQGKEEKAVVKTRASSMEFGSQAHLTIGATGTFTTNIDATGSVAVQSVQTNSSKLAATTGTRATSTASTAGGKQKPSKTTAASSYQSQYALSPSQRAKESMTTAEKFRRAEAEALARGGGPKFEKMTAVSVTDDDYVPIADYSSSAKKKKAKSLGKAVPSVGSFDYNEYAPDNMMTSPGGGGSAVERYRIMQRRKRRRRQRRLIRAGIVLVILTTVLFCWCRYDRGDAKRSDGEVEAVDEKEETGAHLLVEDDALEGSEDDDATDMIEEDKEEIDGRNVAVHVEEDSIEEVAHPSGDDDDDDASDAMVTEPSLASTLKREKIQLINTEKAPIVKAFNAAKTTMTNIDQRCVPFSHFWNKEVRTTAKAQPVLAGLDDLLESMMQ